MIIFTDLDKCLLDSGYTATPLRDFALKLKKKGITISIISSKTEKEILYHYREMGIKGPYGAENGCLVKVDNTKFKPGIESTTIKNDLKKIAEKTETEVELFTEMDNKKIQKITGLPDELIPLAKDRKYSQPFRILKGNENRLKKELENAGYNVIWGGRFIQLYGNCSKGKAVKMIKKYSDDFTIGIGDSKNDYPMLDECDYPFILNSKENEKYRNFEGYGPEVWKKIVNKLLREING